MRGSEVNPPGLAAITFDMDDLEVIREGYNLPGQVPRVVYDRAVPRMLEVLAEVGLPATFFVVTGALARRDWGRLREMQRQGHEVANHSHAHAYLLTLPPSATRRDIGLSTMLLQDNLGRQVAGFRAPSLSMNRAMLDCLVELDYRYDSSVNSTPFFMLEWLYLFLHQPSRSEVLSSLWLRHALAPGQPYLTAPPWPFRRVSSGPLVELPISHVPGLRLPYYATFHFILPFTRRWFRTCFLSQPYLVFHAHALDFLDLEDRGIPPNLRRHPGLGWPWPRKRGYFVEMFCDLRRSHQVVTAQEMARRYREEASNKCP